VSAQAQSPLAHLVLFLVCLSIAGTAIAGAHYYAVDLPKQNAVVAPQNTDGYSCGICVRYCVMGGTPGDRCVNEICQGSCK
jgi:hypothetical protein